LKPALIVFVKNHVLGRVKTRLAVKIGHEKALEVYKILEKRAFDAAHNALFDVHVFFSDFIPENHFWLEKAQAHTQHNSADLGQRMLSAIETIVDLGYEQVLLMGSDIYDIQAEDLKQSYTQLLQTEIIIGPSLDGGFYLFGIQSQLKDLKSFLAYAFLNKIWSHKRVLEELQFCISEYNLKYQILQPKLDIDEYEDLMKESELLNLTHL
jgi:uncharacterized protein